ncbi:dTDP-4-dehydrorhamnose reductase [Pricia sp. S334]|uniref:dTDP-4-dehydrorhamnose reductase n=1 Tax=Pricia mediterranea TaxID=3076079 RepID=A0ABU3L6S8_9FLAO|nr:dTDP-4-dehydrorhamnose reductase [Pricia sp. S334]MDT7828923.1 dTDP-4-dehydrorhamnose reductase [Pricia sp. S334]
MSNVLVTGGRGQLATCIGQVAHIDDDNRFIYTDYTDLNITEEKEVERFFEDTNIQFCINCAAYTAVDQAEAEPKKADLVNHIGTRNLATACKKHRATLIHISTDFVFDGLQSLPYNEEAATRPLGIYGASKLAGETAIIEILEQHYIIRTSWLYSNYGDNFMKTMLRLGQERDSLSVVCDQIGTPTYGIDLARMVLNVLSNSTNMYGIYHYSNEGVASWYDFSKAIFDISGVECHVTPIAGADFPTSAERPAFSVLDKTKVKRDFGIDIPYWRDSLKACLKK